MCGSAAARLRLDRRDEATPGDGLGRRAAAHGDAGLVEGGGRPPLGYREAARRVDAWAGLDPLMAASELDSGSRLLYRNVAFNTYGFLNVREDFLKQHPQAVQRVLAVYEKARLWIQANTSDAARILSEEAKVSLQVALLQLKLRTDLSQPLPGAAHIKALQAASPILLDEALVRPGTNLARTVTDLVDTRFAAKTVRLG